jgi:hypothetical protein
VSNHWARGGEGARGLAQALVETCDAPSNFRYLYELDQSVEEKIKTIATEVYGADGIELSELARKQIDTYTRQGYGQLPSSYLCLSARAILIPSMKSAWRRHNIRSRMIPSSRVFPLVLRMFTARYNLTLLQVSRSPYARCDCLQEQASFTQSWVTCRPCRGSALVPGFGRLVLTRRAKLWDSFRSLLLGFTVQVYEYLSPSQHLLHQSTSFMLSDVILWNKYRCKRITFAPQIREEVLRRNLLK